MARNYEILKESENALYGKFLDFLNHVLKSWTFFKDCVAQHKINEDNLELIYKNEEISNQYYAEIMDECVWTISKNQPVANHLRFIINILHSIQDLERMADHIPSCMKFFFYHPNIDQEVYQIILETLKESFKATQAIFKDLVNNQKSVKAYENALKIQDQYFKYYSERMRNLAKIIKTKSIDQITTIFSGAGVILKYIERNVDHALNIAENFVYVKQSDLFFSKKK